MLILICGLPGSGKSSISKLLSKRLSAIHINSDVVRKRLFPKPDYSEEEKRKVYLQMAAEAEKALKEGKNVILDATFYKNEYRKMMVEAAMRAGPDAYLILCEVGKKETEKRMKNRKGGPSDADFEVYLKLKETFEPIEGEFLKIDSSMPRKELLKQIDAFMSPKGGMNAEQIGRLRKSMGEPRMIETHISWLLLDEFVYKIKKPVKFSFLDFTTMEKRKFACEEEVRLNKRLAPDVYLGVVPVKEDGNDIRPGGKGKTIDYAVKMKKLPQERRMDLLLKERKVTREHIIRIAGIVADFHKKVDTIKDRNYGTAELVKRQIDDLGNFRQAIEEACGMGSKVDFVLERSDAFIDKNKKLFEKRQKGGKIKDCHGDLHSANIFINGMNDVTIFDCIEFNKDFRFIDVASEIAFMSMDLDAFSREELSGLLVDAYLVRTRDMELKNLLRLYKCYRANVRAKVAAIEWSHGKSQEAKERIAKYILLAEKYAKEL